jgi:rhodanese-related sulfurtransferase
MDGLVRTYSPAELKARMEEAEPPVLLDVRSPQELDQQGRLPYDFINIPLGQLRGRLSEVPEGREVVAFCKISARAWDAVAIFRGNGRENIAILEGGAMAWPYEKK